MIDIELHTQEGYGQLEPPAEEQHFTTEEGARLYLTHDLFPRILEAGLGAGGFVLLVRVDEADVPAPISVADALAQEVEE